MAHLRQRLAADGDDRPRLLPRAGGRDPARALLVKKPPDPRAPRPEFAFSFGLLIDRLRDRPCSSKARCSAVAPDYPSLRQIITTFDSARLGVLFLILRRLCAPPPRFGLLALVVGIEIVLGITGFFAGFREPIVLAVLPCSKSSIAEMRALGGAGGRDGRQLRARPAVDGHPRRLSPRVRRGRQVRRTRAARASTASRI